ncbi:uncharacterized protein LOC111407511 isoform X2 [Olea europaea var. sylvestris]|uniref:uncharacterized protein LOC111407511 isoform X2 n=1 Tax=Olea europaea var. sylvestris TaxID=158386 RepID=UPI000C1CEFD5|nr:uncharacterized protein LOC111407511 isoform X2 [Olea europaea var. sylvestris]
MWLPADLKTPPVQMRTIGILKEDMMFRTTWLQRSPTTNDVQLLLEKYVLRRWRQDVSRPYMRVPATYDGLVCTTEQLRYERLCHAFTKMADLVARNEERSNHLLGWIEFQTNQLSNLDIGSSGLHVPEARNDEILNILDPKLMKRKDDPKKLRKKSPLEASSKKSKDRKKQTHKMMTSPKITASYLLKHISLL